MTEDSFHRGDTDGQAVRGDRVTAVAGALVFLLGTGVAVWMSRSGSGWWSAIPAFAAYVAAGSLIGGRLARRARADEATATLPAVPSPSATHVEVHIVGVVPVEVASRIVAAIEGISGVAVDASERDTGPRLAVDVGPDGDLLEVVEHLVQG